jgi:nucleoside-diphosphate-sugar epimerase
MLRDLRSLINTNGFQGETININMQKEAVIRNLAATIIDLWDSGSELVYKPLPVDDPRKRQPDMLKPRTLFNWKLKILLEKGLKQILEYFRGNERSHLTAPRQQTMYKNLIVF